MSQNSPFVRSALLILLYLATQANAMEVADEEWAFLPTWCANTMAFDGQRGPPRFGEYQKKYGNDFGHMHHFCWGMVREIRAASGRIPPHLRRTNLTSAIGDYEYVIRNTHQGFGLRLDTLRRISAVHLRLGEPSKAVAAARQAIREFPEHPGGYISAALAHASAKESDLANKALAEGRERSNDPDQIDRAREVILRR